MLLRPWAFFRDNVYEPTEFKRIRNTVRGRQLNELTIGVLGMGRVGRRVGHIAANGFGMRVIYYDILRLTEEQEQLQQCARCGTPTTGEVCAFCRLVERASR